MKTEMDISQPDFESIFKQSYVRASDRIDQEPTAISIGTYDGKHIPFGTYGNFSCITGPSKVGKSFMKQALVAGYLGGRSRSFFPDIYGHGSGMVFDFDTEQSIWHVQKMVRNVKAMVFSDDFEKRYFAYALREYTPDQRVGFIEWAIDRAFENGKRVGLVCIDGIADLMYNVNDLDATNRLIGRLMRLTTVYKIHIIVIVHLNFGENAKPTGHVGSAITKKAETVLRLKYEDEPNANNLFGIVRAEAIYTRNMRIQPFNFTLQDGLPVSTDTFYNAP